MTLRWVHGSVVRSRIRYGNFGDGVTSVEEAFDDAGSLETIVYRDALDRRNRVETLSDGGVLQTIQTSTYWSATSWTLRETSTTDADGNHVLTWYYNDRGQVALQRTGSSVADSCAQPLQYSSCIVN